MMRAARRWLQQTPTKSRLVRRWEEDDPVSVRCLTRHHIGPRKVPAPGSAVRMQPRAAPAPQIRNNPALPDNAACPCRAGFGPSGAGNACTAVIYAMPRSCRASPSYDGVPREWPQRQAPRPTQTPPPRTGKRFSASLDFESTLPNSKREALRCCSRCCRKPPLDHPSPLVRTPIAAGIA
jgi:hypothetical protein